MPFRVDFLKRWKLWFVVSGIFLIIALFGIFVRGLNYGIDFTGGTQMDLQFSHAISVTQVRGVLDGQGLAQSTVVYIGHGNRQVLVTTPTISEHERGVLLTKMNSVASYKEISTSRVSSIIGQQTERTALIAVLIATAAIILYIAIRFEMRFAVAGIIALLVDVIVTVGLVALIHVVLTTYFIMAVLTIFGYSMNDRIIVFDRIRENLHKQKKNEPLDEVVNRSLNQVLMRSINTSTTVMMALAALLVFGGATIRDFAVTMLLGVFIGTFTSLFIASPVWVLWRKHDDAKRRTAPKPA